MATRRWRSAMPATSASSAGPSSKRRVEWYIAMRPASGGAARYGSGSAARQYRASRGAGPGPWRARLPGDQAPVRLRQSSLPRADQEHRPAAHAVCAGEYLDGAPAADRYRIAAPEQPRDGDNPVPSLHLRKPPSPLATSPKKISRLWRQRSATPSLPDLVRPSLERLVYGPQPSLFNLMTDRGTHQKAFFPHIAKSVRPRITRSPLSDQCET